MIDRRLEKEQGIDILAYPTANPLELFNKAFALTKPVCKEVPPIRRYFQTNK